MKKLVYVFAVVAISLGFAVLQVTVGNAEDASIVTEIQCGSPDIPNYTGVLKLRADTYDVYVKLGKVGQSAVVSGYAGSADGKQMCSVIGSTQANATDWRKLGTYTDFTGTEDTLVQLSSVVLENLPDANRPSLMFVSQTSPVCVPTTECVTTIAGQTAYIRPAGTALENDALHVVRVDSVDLAGVTKVQYYADNELLYETKTLQDFKNEDIPFYANKLVRVLHYASGQTAVIETNAPAVSHDNLWTTLQRYAKKYRNTLIVFLGVIAGLIIVRITSLALRHFERRRQWKINHGFIHEEADLAVTPEQIRRLRRHAITKTVYIYTERVIVVVACIAGFVLVSNAFFLQVGTVSGLSMFSTLNDGQKILINKTPVTFARLNNNQFVPKRGDIVVASPNFGTIDTSIKQDDETLIIKRVVGLPGERVVVTGQSLMVYNKEHPEGLDPDASVKWSANIQREASVDTMDVTLGENEIFLAGDNRPVSIDSRFNGPIATSQVLGVVIN